ncbi:MAG: FAD-dependent oxidoreductase [Anaerococcus sp.]
MTDRYLIVGGVAGGASIGTRIRRLDEKAEIVIFEQGPHVSFSNCSLPNYFSGQVENIDDLVLMDPQGFKEKYNIDVRIESKVVKIKPEEKTIVVEDISKGEKYEEKYDKLILSPGADAIRPGSIKGINNDNVFTLKNVVDVSKIDSYINEKNVKDVAVIGGGFIGIEAMENMRLKGFNISLIEAMDQVMAPFDYDMAQTLHKEIVDNGVNLILNDGVSEIKDGKVVLDSGKEVKADIVVLAIGVSPNTKLAEEAGMELGETKAIKVNHNYQTNFKDIYAVGDAIELVNFQTGKKQRLALAGPAQKQARAAADSIFNRPVRNRGVVGASVLRIFDLNAASVGLNEKALKKEGIDYRFSYVLPSDRVGLMPEASTMFFKLIFAYPSGKILGAQAIGKGPVDKRIDIVSSLIQMNGYLEDLKDMEFAYAPDFSTAKDVTNQAAQVGLNVLNEEYKQVPVTKVRELVEEGAFIIDVRGEDEFSNGHLKNAKNIPLGQIRDRLDEIPRDKDIYLHCRSSQRSYLAIKILQGNGYTNLYNIQGSFLGISLYEYYNDKTLGREPIVTEYNFN